MMLDSLPKEVSLELSPPPHPGKISRSNLREQHTHRHMSALNLWRSHETVAQICGLAMRGGLWGWAEAKRK